MTGFKIGWVIGPKDLVEAVFMVHQNVPFCVSTPLQEAVAVGFEKVLGTSFLSLIGVAEEKGYFQWLHNMYEKKRDKLCNILSDSGLIPMKPQGSYFVLADTSKIPQEVYTNNR